MGLETAESNQKFKVEGLVAHLEIKSYQSADLYLLLSSGSICGANDAERLCRSGSLALGKSFGRID